MTVYITEINVIYNIVKRTREKEPVRDIDEDRKRICYRIPYPEEKQGISVGDIHGNKPRTFEELYKLADQVFYKVKARKNYCEIWDVDRKNGGKHT